jgi:hypothetical protein
VARVRSLSRDDDGGIPPDGERRLRLADDGTSRAVGSGSRHVSGLFPPAGPRMGYRITAPGAMSMTFSNAAKRARYRERHLGVDGEKVRRTQSQQPAPGS